MGLWRGARVILKVMLVAVFVSLTASLVAYFFAARGPTIESNSVLWLRIPNQLAEHQTDDIWSQLIGRREFGDRGDPKSQGRRSHTGRRSGAAL